MAPKAAEAPDLLGADHRHDDWRAEAERIARVASAARRHRTLRRAHDEALSLAPDTPVASSELTPRELVGRLATARASGLVVEDAGLSIRGSTSWTAEEFARRRALVGELQDLVAEIGVPTQHHWWACGLMDFSAGADVRALREVVAEALSAVSRLRQASVALGKLLRYRLEFGDVKRTELERTILGALKVAEAPGLLGALHRHADWISESERLVEVSSAARRHAEIRARLDEVLLPEAWDRDVLAESRALKACGDKWWRFFVPSFIKAHYRIRGLCRKGVPAFVGTQLDLVDAILDAKRQRRLIAASHDLVSRLFPDLTLGDGVETHRAFSDAADWLLQLHRDESTGRVDSHVHDLLHCLSDGLPDPAELRAAASSCESEADALGETLRALEEAMSLRTDRVEPGEALEERSYGELEAWLRGAGRQTNSVQDVVRFNRLEKRAAKEGIAEAASAAASQEDTTRLGELFEDRCCNAWLDLAFRDAAGAVSTPDVVAARVEIRTLRRLIAASHDLVERLFPDLTLGDAVEAHPAFSDVADWLLQLHRDESAGVVDPHVHDLLDCLSGRRPDPAVLENALDTCRRCKETLEEALRALAETMAFRADRVGPGEALEERSYGGLDAWLRDAESRIDSVSDIVRFNQLEERAASEGLLEVVKAGSSREYGEQLLKRFDHACYSSWLDTAFQERPPLAEFDSASHAGLVARFRDLDTAQFHRNRAAIAERHWQQLPRHHGGGQLGVLKREFQKKRRHMPVRELMKAAGRPIQKIKPVFMMSPLSIAKYIPPGSVEFDLVVLDEASQVRPVEALGAMIRGRQAVVVGDDKQLPPTTFFDRMAADDSEEASQTTDLESILGMFRAKGAPERMLCWHYRSRHESLIAVSNREFYDERLVVFPSPDAGRTETGLVFHHDADSHYERRGVNTGEAKAVARAVMKHARASPAMTLGVAAFSSEQARRIEDELDALRRFDLSCEGFFAGHPEEPFFVKNLENVQGDERDVILISIGYGTTDGRHLPMNFGPLNQNGGERRLNVLITRARRRCIVYCNFIGEDLDLSRSKARGVEALKTFLEYARLGTMAGASPGATGAESPFEKAVAARLQTLGYEVEHHVGSGACVIDLAVRDPSRSGRYVLGIECDGASYHNTSEARDRDRLRQEALESRGWKLHRVWSSDWFANPDREIERVQGAIREAQAAALAPAPERSVRRPDRAAKPLERSPESNVEAPQAARYEVARLVVDVQPVSLHETPVGRLAEWIREVVAVESPVHFEEVMRRIGAALGVGRSGARIRERIRSAAKFGAQQDLYDLDQDDFLWWPGHRNVRVRRRGPEHPPTLRKIEMISREEIGAALIHVVQASYGIEPAEAVREAIRLFGFGRAGQVIVNCCKNVLKNLLEDDALVLSGDFLHLPEDAS